MASLEPTPLNLLQAEGPAELLSRIDELRNLGFRHRICLPQLVICGHRGCGKTSVFQAITGLSFPVSHTVRTRFAIEGIFRRSAEVSTSVRIRPGPNASPDHKHKLQTFSAQHNWLENVSEFLEKAEQYIGLNEERRFSQDTLQLEVSGPTLPDLTVIDLPGLIQEPGDNETVEDVALVRELTESYTNNPRSIVLAIISADIPLRQQSALQLTASCASRTMGIITKADKLDPCSSGLTTLYARVKHQDTPPNLGWHVLKNIDTEHKGSFGLSRDETESLFLSSSTPWKSLSPNAVGIDSLRDRLNKILLSQVELQLSMLSSEIQKELEIQRESLQRLGPDMSTPAERRFHITSIGETIQTFTRDAVLGEYSDSYFRQRSNRSVRRLRSIIRKWAEDFAVDMRQRGHSHYIYDNPTMSIAPTLGFPDDPQPMLKSEYIRGIHQLLKSNNVRGITGLANSRIIGELFIRQSLKWDKITKAHISEIWKKVKQFLDELLHHIAGPHTSKAIMREIINREMEERLRKTNSKVDELLKPYKRMIPSTLNEQLSFRLRQIQRKSSEKADPNDISDDVDLSLCDEILDCMQVYYATALGVFLDNIAGLAIENCLLDGIESIMSPTRISQMTDNEIERLATDSNEVRNARAATARKVKVFEVTAAACTRCQMAALESSAQNYTTSSDISTPNSPTFGSDFSSQKDSPSSSEVEFFENTPVRRSLSRGMRHRRSSSSRGVLMFPVPIRIEEVPPSTADKRPSSSIGSNPPSPARPPPFEPRKPSSRRLSVGASRVQAVPDRQPTPDLLHPGNASPSRIYTHGRAVSADKIVSRSHDLLSPASFSFEASQHRRALSVERIMPPLPETMAPSSRHMRAWSAEKFTTLPAPPPRSPARRTLSLSILPGPKNNGFRPLQRRLSKLKPVNKAKRKSIPEISLPFNFHHYGSVASMDSAKAV
ncbi:hypothetical protein CPC735_030020 [Coccidioides posadasii C735 delta SOWgp]|uniref:GED domain-containing protein n=1 Tax=Coccidioides posadasii (strain C735) TaxID=222929 RepID=C5P4M6_COCP7|nr:hypothetical protein CPC735_030020 [Coccidioides posadasii C735 delta SOWgp]EER27666.1 hypothetical protein CPC735_030020 [Coccidioides posadasii C735 delta SOWgp]|eukprot:XP_003069811.1 hypothetical protein CPC735_030020 [Coccidioides posadasii C735 delta SOWgp]